MSKLNGEIYKGKITELTRQINATDIGKAVQGINIVEMFRDVSKLDLKAGNLDIPKVKLKKKEPIEYVVKEEKDYKTDLKAGNLYIPKVELNKKEEQDNEMEL